LLRTEAYAPLNQQGGGEIRSPKRAVRWRIQGPALTRYIAPEGEAVGNQHWLIVEYPRSGLLNMLAQDDYKAAQLLHRTAALDWTRDWSAPQR